MDNRDRVIYDYDLAVLLKKIEKKMKKKVNKFHQQISSVAYKSVVVL